MIQIKQPALDIHNKFTFELYDKQGNLKETAQAFNVANSTRYVCVNLGGSWPGSVWNDKYTSWNYQQRQGIKQVLMGTGTGEEPKASDERLYAKCFCKEISFSLVNTPKTYNEPIHFQGKVTFEANSNYVGNLTEVGLGCSSEWLYSHAWVTNVEGQQIAISKTANDMLIVTVDIYFTIKLPADPGFDFKFFPIWGTSFMNALPTIPGRNISLSTLYAPPANGMILESPIKCIQDRWSGYSSLYANTNNAKACINEGGGQVIPINLELLNKAWYAENGNYGFIHSIVIDGYGAIALPNEKICPKYKLNGITIGTGDGVKTYFYTPVNEPYSQKIYVDGVEQTSGVTFVKADARKSPFWNKFIGANMIDFYDASNKWYREANVPYPNFSHVAMSTKVVNIDNLDYGPAVPYYSNVRKSGCEVFYFDENGITCDHIRIGPTAWSTRWTYLSYTNDDIFDTSKTPTWTRAIGIAEVGTHYFEKITAKYWRIEGYTQSELGMYLSTIERSWSQSDHALNECALVVGDSAVYDFGKIGITFDTPPAEGALITMDAVLDLPYKSPDTGITISYAATVPDPMAE